MSGRAQPPRPIRCEERGVAVSFFSPFAGEKKAMARRSDGGFDQPPFFFLV